MIKKFTLNKQTKQLSIEWENKKIPTSLLTYEYLRVSQPASGNKVISHKKQVQLLTIDALGKHGFRFYFDDQHNAIYSGEFLTELARDYQLRWAAYLEQLKLSGHSREAMIDIKQL
jgi:DUF971 family protein